MLSADQMSTQVEDIMDSSMGSNESLRLPYRLEPPHSSFTNPGRFMGLLRSIISISI
jgi:hypothetical protein